ncbi:MAG: BspA family leucine-rich repeat surface protein [Flavobacteriaceae bacterium]
MKSKITFFLFLIATTFTFSQGFITVWTVVEGGTNERSINIGTSGSGYNYNIDWGDGSPNESGLTGDTYHTYDTGGTYTVEITGSFPRIKFTNDRKIVSVEQWGNSQWTSMERAFGGCLNLKINASDIPDLSNVTDMSYMLSSVKKINQDLSLWDVSNVTNMSNLFSYDRTFNQDLSMWDVSNVTDMSNMFKYAKSFNQDLSLWDVSSVTDMSYMFLSAVNYNQNLASWDISSVTDMSAMFNDIILSTNNYDATLTGWATLETGESQIPTNIVFDGGDSKYCSSESERIELQDTFGWTITDNGKHGSCGKGVDGFITTWTSVQYEYEKTITIPTIGTGYNYSIDWGDGSAIETGITGNVSHTYTDFGSYSVEITGDFPRIYFNNGSQKTKITGVDQWGTGQWSSMENSFFWCSKLKLYASDAPDLSSVTNMSNMFRSCIILDQDISSWDVSNVTNMYRLFERTENYNQSLNGWDVSNVLNMSRMFWYATDFNSDISSWDVSKVIDMSYMFGNAGSFNTNIGNWNVSNVTSMSNMFNYARSFNKNINSWNVANVSNMRDMFSYSAFDEDISSWNVGSVTDMSNMFSNTDFNQNIGAWDVSSVTTMAQMFLSNKFFDQNIGAWDISNVASLSGILYSLSVTNYDALLAGWATLDGANGETQIPNGLVLSAGLSQYCNSTAQRTSLINDFSWTITDFGENCSLSVDDENLSRVKIVPNPSSGKFRIDALQENVDVTIYDINGKQLFKQTDYNDGFIDINQLSQGIYFVRITNEHLNFSKKLIIK